MVSIELWAIGDGRSINIWKDQWLLQDKTLENFVDQLSIHMENWTVGDLVDGSGARNLSLLDRILQDSILRKFNALLPPDQDIGLDVRLWPGKKLKEFFVASAYNFLHDVSPSMKRMEWKKVWNLEAAKRIRCFGWQTLHGRLLTNQCRRKWGLGNPFCQNCPSQEESTLYLLRLCL